MVETRPRARRRRPGGRNLGSLRGDRQHAARRRDPDRHRGGTQLGRRPEPLPRRAGRSRAFDPGVRRARFRPAVLGCRRRPADGRRAARHSATVAPGSGAHARVRPPAAADQRQPRARRPTGPGSRPAPCRHGARRRGPRGRSCPGGLCAGAGTRRGTAADPTLLFARIARARAGAAGAKRLRRPGAPSLRAADALPGSGRGHQRRARSEIYGRARRAARRRRPVVHQDALAALRADRKRSRRSHLAHGAGRAGRGAPQCKTA